MSLKAWWADVSTAARNWANAYDNVARSEDAPESEQRRAEAWEDVARHGMWYAIRGDGYNQRVERGEIADGRYDDPANFDAINDAIQAAPLLDTEENVRQGGDAIPEPDWELYPPDQVEAAQAAWHEDNERERQRILADDDRAQDEEAAEHAARQAHELAARDAFVKAVAATLSPDEAQEILDDAAERASHLKGCNQDVSQCSTCCANETESVDAAEARQMETDAARLALARAENEAAEPDDSDGRDDSDDSDGRDESADDTAPHGDPAHDRAPDDRGDPGGPSEGAPPDGNPPDGNAPDGDASDERTPDESDGGTPSESDGPAPDSDGQSDDDSDERPSESDAPATEESDRPDDDDSDGRTGDQPDDDSDGLPDDDERERDDGRHDAPAHDREPARRDREDEDDDEDDDEHPAGARDQDQYADGPDPLDYSTSEEEDNWNNFRETPEWLLYPHEHQDHPYHQAKQAYEAGDPDWYRRGEAAESSGSDDDERERDDGAGEDGAPAPGAVLVDLEEVVADFERDGENTDGVDEDADEDGDAA